MLLQFGDRGDNVRYLQYGLHILCCSPNGFDGEFGNGTLTAVKKFQSKYGLVSDGIVGDVTWNTLKNEIATIQAQLNKKGCSVGTVDGIAGPATYNAVISFQNKNGLTADGQVGPATWDVLFDTISGGNSYSRILKLTSPLMYGEDIRAVQNKLNSLGYVAGTADGYYGNDTKNAVINLQNTFGITADGIVGPTTWKYLFETNASVSNILKVAGNIGLFENAEFTFTELNSKTPEVRLSLSPAIYVQGELSLTGSLSGSMTNNYINLSLSPDTITTNIINNLSTINIEHDIDPKTLKASISQLTQTQNINDNISYSITLNDFGALEITLEAVIPANTDINFGGINLNLGVNLYQRLIVTIKPNRLPPPSNNGVISEIAIPLYKPESEILPNDVVIKNMKYVNYISLIAVALLTGMKVISTTLASTANGPLSILLALVFFILR